MVVTVVVVVSAVDVATTGLGGGHGGGGKGRRGRSGHGVMSSSGMRRAFSPDGATEFDPDGRPRMSIPASSRRLVIWRQGCQPVRVWGDAQAAEAVITAMRISRM